jgi:hypothetical protein
MILRERGLRVTKDVRVAALLTPGAVLTDDIAVRVKNLIGNPLVSAEIVKVSDISAANAATTTDLLRPTSDAVSSVRHGTAGSTVPPFYVDVDEPVLNTADFLSNDVTTIGQMFFGYGTGAYPASRRILALTLHAVVKTLAAGVTVLDPQLVLTGATPSGLYLPSRTVDFSQGQIQIDNLTWTARPDGLPLTSADINALSNIATGQVGWQHTAPVQPAGYALYQAWLSVLSVPETRLAFGTATLTTDGWVTVPMGTPALADTWTPAAATQYAVIFTIVGDGSFSIEAIDAGVAHPDAAAAAMVLSSDGFPAGIASTDTAAPAVLGVDGNGLPVWGQPYGEVIEEEIYAGRTVEVEVTLPNAGQATTGYGSVRLVVEQVSTLTSAALVVKLKRRADSVQVGGDVQITPNEVRGAPRLAQIVTLPFLSAATGLGTTQHYLEISCAGAQGQGWLITTISDGETVTTQKLSAGSQTFEVSTTGAWAAVGGVTTIAASNTFFHSGAWSLAMRHTSGGGPDTATTPTGVGGFVVTPGLLYQVGGWFRDDGTNHATESLQIVFYTSGGAPIGSPTVIGSVVSTAAWQQVFGSTVAPPTAAFAAIQWVSTGGAVSAFFYADDFTVLESGIYSILDGNTDTVTVGGVELVDRQVPIVLAGMRVAPAGLAAAVVP